MERIELGQGHWAEVECLPSGLCVTRRSNPEMLVTAPSMEQMRQVLPAVIDDLRTRAAIRKGEA